MEVEIKPNNYMKSTEVIKNPSNEFTEDFSCEKCLEDNGGWEPPYKCPHAI